MMNRIKALKRIELVYGLVLLFLLAMIFGFNMLAGGTITSPQQLAIDLASPLNSPQDWIIQDWATVKYRALFRLIVRSTWAAIFAPSDAWGFYLVFIAWSFVLFYGTLVALYFYLRQLEFDRQTSFLGCLLFLAAPPVLLAYKYPVYTREDVLAYFLILLGLISIFKFKPLLMSLIAAAAVLTRETTLILPLAYFLGPETSWGKKILVFIPPVAAFVGLRLLWGLVIGNSFDSSVLNFTLPWETLAFLFCVFGALWLPYLVGLRERWRRTDASSYAWRVLTSSGPAICVVVMLATLLLARAREPRIVFILFPWAIPFALDWFRNHLDDLKARAASYGFWMLALALFGAISALVLYFHLTNPELMRYYLADFKNGYWLFVGTANLSVTLALFLPMPRRGATVQHNV